MNPAAKPWGRPLGESDIGSGMRRWLRLGWLAGAVFFGGCVGGLNEIPPGRTGSDERRITHRPQGHILTNTGVWSPDGEWLIYDVREQGNVFSGDRIERVHVPTGAVELLFQSRAGAKCGVVTYSPVAEQVVFIHGPENPTADWSYSASRRRGVVVDVSGVEDPFTLDARDLTEPLTPGALRGGTHVHVFSGDGKWISFTYEDQLLASFDREEGETEVNLRNVGISVPSGPVEVDRDHPRNHDGAYFSVLVSSTVAHPVPGSDEISRAFSDAWVGDNGYLRPDGTRQKRAIAYQGLVRNRAGEPMAEVFMADLPDDLTQPSAAGPLEGTLTTRPRPPANVVQRRLTYTEDRIHPGLQGPRHWLRSSPDGSRIAFLMKDDDGIPQIWTISPNGGEPVPVTANRWGPSSSFSWSPDGEWIAYAMDNSIFVTEVASGQSHRLTARSADPDAPQSYAAVFSPDGTHIACVRSVGEEGKHFNHIFVVKFDSAAVPRG